MEEAEEKYEGCVCGGEMFQFFWFLFFGFCFLVFVFWFLFFLGVFCFLFFWGLLVL